MVGCGGKIGGRAGTLELQTLFEEETKALEDNCLVKDRGLVETEELRDRPKGKAWVEVLVRAQSMYWVWVLAMSTEAGVWTLLLITQLNSKIKEC